MCLQSGLSRNEFYDYTVTFMGRFNPNDKLYISKLKQIAKSGVDGLCA